MANFVVGFTGGIGSGKTTIANMFGDLGVEIIDADLVARQVVEPNSPALADISQYFGRAFITKQGELNRGLLRSRIFSNDQDKLWLNNLLHPLIRQAMVAQVKASQSPYCLLVAPLLIENKLNHLVNKILVIDVDEETQLARTLKRDTSCSKAEIKAIMASQVPRAARLTAADDVIDNSGCDLARVNRQVKQLHQYYLKLCLNEGNLR